MKKDTKAVRNQKKLGKKTQCASGLVVGIWLIIRESNTD